MVARAGGVGSPGGVVQPGCGHRSGLDAARLPAVGRFFPGRRAPSGTLAEECIAAGEVKTADLGNRPRFELGPANDPISTKFGGVRRPGVAWIGPDLGRFRQRPDLGRSSTPNS